MKEREESFESEGREERAGKEGDIEREGKEGRESPAKGKNEKNRMMKRL